MKVLLLRHGEAVDDAPSGDGDRWLTAHGRQATRRVAERMATHCAPRTIWTSPLVRATQTAEIVAGALGLEDNLSVERSLITGDVDALLRRLRAFDGANPLLLVGHEPTLSTLTRRLLGADTWPGYKKSMVCGLRWDRTGMARFEWTLLPKGPKLVERWEDLFA
ncbi:MAG: phosphohistidine phosphatase SixA [Deltaproteobacteria bacterium]|nr:phosphohistidine phosphatase SixA [Deltaproteobacteria bacterium]